MVITGLETFVVTRYHGLRHVVRVHDKWAINIDWSSAHGLANTELQDLGEGTLQSGTSGAPGLSSRTSGSIQGNCHSFSKGLGLLTEVWGVPASLGGVQEPGMGCGRNIPEGG
jgi:hypothetical protein